MAGLAKPPPPVVAKVTHHTIELNWEDALGNVKSEMQKGDGRTRICIQEEDRQRTWGNVYTGYAKKHIMAGLEPTTQYRYRIRFMNNHANSEWSQVVAVSTTKEPLTGDHLHRAVNMRTLDTLESILDSGDVMIDVPDKLGFSPLMQAAQKGYTDVMAILISKHADLNGQNDAGKTPMMLACYAGKKESVELLREHGASYTVTDRNGSSAIHFAVDGKNSDLLDYILEDGADIEAKDRTSGWTPLLRCAALHGDINVGTLLVKHGAQIDSKDNDGKTALMIAVINGHLALVQLLLDRHADVTVKNEFGKSVYEMAQSMERVGIVKVLAGYMDEMKIKYH